MNSEAGKLIRGTVEAHTTLVLFETISTMLESSDIKGDRARAVARKALTLLRREQQLLLRDFDRASMSVKRAMEDSL